jgi:mRNA interferase MazF
MQMSSNRPKYGQIWMCYIHASEGSIQSGYRPVFVLSNNKNNTYAPTVNVIPMTSKMNKRKLPVHVELWDYEQYGLERPSTLLVEQTTTVSVDDLGKCIGAITDKATLEKIIDAMSVQFPILQMLVAI